MTEAEMNAILGPIEAREVERVEADLNRLFGQHGPVERVYETAEVYDNNAPPTRPPDATELRGWTVLGRVEIGRHMLPAEGSDVGGAEDEGYVEHRGEILGAILAAYTAGRDYKPMPAQTKPSHPEGDPEALWQSRLQRFSDAERERIGRIEQIILEVFSPHVTVCRMVRGEPLWLVGADKLAVAGFVLSPQTDEEMRQMFRSVVKDCVMRKRVADEVAILEASAVVVPIGDLPERYERHQAAARRREEEARIQALGFSPLDLGRAH